jgi:hypothetical protein
VWEQAQTLCDEMKVATVKTKDFIEDLGIQPAGSNTSFQETFSYSWKASL